MTLPSDFDKFFAELFHDYLQKCESELWRSFENIPVLKDEHGRSEASNPHNQCLFGRWINLIKELPSVETIAHDCAKELIQTWKNNKKLSEGDITTIVKKFLAIAIPMGLYAVSRGNTEKALANLYVNKQGKDGFDA